MSVDGDVRVLIDFDRNGHILTDATYNAGAANLLPRRLPYSGLSITTITPTFRTMSNSSPLLLTISELQTGDTLILGTELVNDPFKVAITPSVQHVLNFRAKKLTGTSGGLTRTIRYYTAAGATNGTSVSTIGGFTAGTAVQNTITFTPPANTAYFRLDLTEFGTNDDSDWEFDNFYLGLISVGNTGDYVGPEISKIETAITDRILSLNWSLGGSDPWDWVMRSGSATIEIDNDDLLLVPEGTGSVVTSADEINGAITIIQVYYNGAWYNLWSGYVDDVIFDFNPKSIKTITFECSQRLETLPEVLVDIGTYYYRAAINYSVDALNLSEIDTSYFVPPNLTQFLSALYGVHTNILSTTLSASTDAMALVPKWRSEGIPLWNIYKFLALRLIGYVFIDENGSLVLKTRPTSGGTTVTVDPSTQVNDHKYLFGYKYSKGILLKRTALQTTLKSATVFRQFNLTTVSSINNGVTSTVTYDTQEPGHYANFLPVQKVVRAGVWTRITDENADIGIDNPTADQFYTTFGLLQPSASLLYQIFPTTVFSTTFKQLDENTIEIKFNNSSGGTCTIEATDGPPEKFELRCSDAQIHTTEELLLKSGAPDDLPIMDIDMTEAEDGQYATNPHMTYWRDHVAEKVGFFRSITLRDRPTDATWLQRMLDLRPGTMKIIDMTMSSVLPGVSNRRHHVMGYDGTFSPSEGLNVNYTLYR